MIISTGMNTIESITKAVSIVERYNLPYALLHTTNIYPTPPRLVRLGAMQQMQEAFPHAVIGLSDHTTSNLACFAAVALGANILERHFIDSMERTGPDVANSMDSTRLKELITGARDIYAMRGGNKAAVQEEQVTIDFAFATVVTIESIRKGEEFTKENIWVKRPGTGEIKAGDYENVIGKVSTRDIEMDRHLCWSDIK